MFWWLFSLINISNLSRQQWLIIEKRLDMHFWPYMEVFQQRLGKSCCHLSLEKRGCHHPIFLMKQITFEAIGPRLQTLYFYKAEGSSHWIESNKYIYMINSQACRILYPFFGSHPTFPFDMSINTRQFSHLPIIHSPFRSSETTAKDISGVIEPQMTMGEGELLFSRF